MFNKLFTLRTGSLILMNLLAGIALLGISAAIFAISVNKPIGDDFGGIAAYEPHEWAEETLESVTSTGRYGQSILASITYGALRENIVTILPYISLGWTILVIYLYCSSLFRVFKYDRKYITASTAAIFTFFLLFINNNVNYGTPQTWISYQLFFWPSGIITYTIPLLIWTTAVYLLFIRASQKPSITKRGKLTLLAIITVLTGLFNEIQPISFIAVTSFLLMLSFIPTFNFLSFQRMKLGVVLFSSLLSVGVLFLSKGNQVRREATGATAQDLPDIIGAAFRNFETALSHLYLRPRELLLLVALGLVLGYIFSIHGKNLQKAGTRLIQIGLLGIVLWIGCLFTALALVVWGYGTGAGVYTRILLIPQILYIFSLPVFASGIYLIIQGKIPLLLKTAGFVGCTFLVLLCTPNYIAKMVSQLNSSLGYHNAWIEQDRLLKERSRTNPVETIYLPPSAAGIGDGFSLRCYGPYSSSTIWLNDQIEAYYGVKEVCSVDDKAMKDR